MIALPPFLHIIAKWTSSFLLFICLQRFIITSREYFVYLYLFFRRRAKESDTNCFLNALHSTCNILRVSSFENKIFKTQKIMKTILHGPVSKKIKIKWKIVPQIDGIFGVFRKKWYTDLVLFTFFRHLVMPRVKRENGKMILGIWQIYGFIYLKKEYTDAYARSVGRISHPEITNIFDKYHMWHHVMHIRKRELLFIYSWMPAKIPFGVEHSLVYTHIHNLWMPRQGNLAHQCNAQRQHN